MEIKVVGSGISWEQRVNSCYCIDEDILVDCGEGCIKNFVQAGVSFDSVKYILVTHLHSDHTFSLVTYVFKYVKLKKDKNDTLTIYGPKGIRRYLTIFMRLNGLKIKNICDYVNIVEIKKFGVPFKLKNYNIIPYSLKHGELLNIGYIFDDGKKIGFSGDTGYDSALTNFVSKCDTIFLDCSGIETTFTHLGVDKFLVLQDKFKDCKFYAIHCCDMVYYDNDLHITKAHENERITL